MESVILVRYAEIHLKGLNRPYFERALCDAIKKKLLPLKTTVYREQGRIFIYGVPKDELREACIKASKVFGVHSVSPTYSVEKDWNEIVDSAYELMGKELETSRAKNPTFKVFAKRADKKFPMRSQEICSELGHLLLEKFDALQVDVHQPEIEMHVEIRQNNAFIYTTFFPGVGGMPVGTNGMATLLISGGIDSPVAGYMIAKRGVRINAVHFYSYPYTSERARDKVVDLAKIVAEYSDGMKVFLVPFTEIQTTIYEKCPPTETTILMRRLMMKISERIARREGSMALITGESIGQVASQTIESLAVTNDAVTLPVFRPLIGFDKDEIVDYAKKIGTFETSILPYEDCCTVFVPKHPVTRPDIQQLRDSEALVDFEPMMRKAIEETEIVEL